VHDFGCEHGKSEICSEKKYNSQKGKGTKEEEKNKTTINIFLVNTIW